MRRGLWREAGPAVHARNRRARPQGNTGELLTSYSQIKRTRLQEASAGQSEVEGIPIWRSLRLWFTLPDYPNQREAPWLCTGRLSIKGNGLSLAVGLGHDQSVLFSRFWLYREGHRDKSVKLYWMKTSEAWPKGTWPENHWTCFDETKPGRRSNGRRETDIGSVHQIRSGPDAGQWSWSMTATLSGPRYPGSTSGTMVSRQEAVRLVGECYERMLVFYSRLGS